MEKIEREALDFMNVESFSQLPFIQPIKEKPITLFGKEFGGGSDNTNTITTIIMSESIDSNSFQFHDEVETNAKEIHHIEMNVEINRKYECHYCFRSFPTSQALGGHQNAHKKERQNAKQALLQSSKVHEMNVYDGIMNRHRLGEADATTRLSHHHSTWTNINTNTHRFNGNGYNVNSHNYYPQSSLAFWKIPPVSSSSHDEKKGEVQDHVCLDLHL